MCVCVFEREFSHYCVLERESVCVCDCVCICRCVHKCLIIRQAGEISRDK